MILDLSLFVGSLATLNIATATTYYDCMTLHHALILNSIQTYREAPIKFNHDNALVVFSMW